MNDSVYSLVRNLIVLAAALGAIGLASACGERSGAEPLATQQAQPEIGGTRLLPTLYPTATQPPSPTPVAPNTPQPTAPPATEVAFDQLVVDVTYAIPLLDLNRRIRGNVAGEIEVIDQIRGESLTLKNRPGVIVEMQQSLPRATIEDLPAGCDSCVQVSYELPMTGQAGSGWLRDTQLLASLDNYTAAVLGPHFPPGTIAGLRREATAYQVAHSSAITAGGELWTWTATESQISQPVIASGVLALVTGYVASLDSSSLLSSVGYLCYQGSGSESLQLGGPEGTVLVEVRCPELYLPGKLVPIYSALGEEVAKKLEASEARPPELPIKLDTVVHYRRADGVSLSLANDGRLGVIDGNGFSYTLTVTTTQTMSLTEALLRSTLLRPGPLAIFDEEPGNVILVRGYDSVYELAWMNSDEIPQALVEPWDRLIELALEASGLWDGEPPTPTPTATSAGG